LIMINDGMYLLRKKKFALHVTFEPIHNYVA